MCWKASHGNNTVNLKRINRFLHIQFTFKQWCWNEQVSVRLMGAVSWIALMILLYYHEKRETKILFFRGWILRIISNSIPSSNFFFKQGRRSAVRPSRMENDSTILHLTLYSFVVHCWHLRSLIWGHLLLDWLFVVIFRFGIFPACNEYRFFVEIIIN